MTQAKQELEKHLKVHPDEPRSAYRLKRIKKLRAAIKKLQTYVQNPKAKIVDYCSRKIEGKRLGTSLVKGAAEFMVKARMAKSKHMRWTKHGVHDVLRVRTAPIKRDLEDRMIVACPQVLNSPTSRAHTISLAPAWVTSGRAEALEDVAILSATRCSI